MPEKLTCAECGAPIPPDARDELCPRCMLRLGLEAAQQDTLPPEEPAPAQPHPPGTIIRYFGDYELLEEIGRGGMGVVYKARQVSLNRLVAVKMIRSGELATEAEIKRFESEARAAASLQHPNIVAIHEVGVHEGQHYFSMDYIDGPSLAEVVQENPLPPKRAGRYVQIIAEAIHAAHQRNIVHRDLKPSNVLIDAADQPHVTDFGLAKRLENAEPGTRNRELTVSDQMLGTPGYLPPEQVSRKYGKVGPHSDVYSLGAILYRLVTGRAPFAADTVDATLLQVVNNEPVSPRALNPSVPRDLDTICLKCLRKEPKARYASAAALAEDLRRWQAGEPILARPVSVFGKLWRWCRRNPALASLTVALGMALILGLAAVKWQWVVLIAAVGLAAVTMLWGLAVRERGRALHERARAERQQARAEQELERALSAESEARLVLRFFQDKVLAAARPEGQEGGLGRHVTLRSAIEVAEAAVAASFSHQPLVEASIRDVLGQTYYYLSDYSNSVKQWERTLAVRRAQLGDAHLETLRAINNLANAYQADGRFTEAVVLREETLRLSKVKLGPNHPGTLCSMDKLRRAYLAGGRTRAASSLVDEFSDWVEKDEDAFAPEDFRSWHNDWRLWWAIDPDTDTLSLSGPTLRPELPDGWETSYAQSCRGGTLIALRQYAEAEKLLLEGYQGLKQREAEIPASTLKEAGERLVRLYEYWGKPDQAAEWRQEFSAAEQNTEERPKP